jgi:hypothetical protein
MSLRLLEQLVDFYNRTMGSGILESSWAFLVATEISQPSLLFRAIMFDQIVVDRWEVECSLPLLLLAVSMQVARLCRRRHLHIVLEYGVPW